jgi:hypothetical protein
LFTTGRYDKDGDQQSLLFGVCFPSARSSSVSFFGAHHFVEWQVFRPRNVKAYGALCKRISGTNSHS